MSIQVSAVPTEYVENVWPKVEAFIEGSAKYTYDRYTADDIFDLLMHYDHALWIAFDGDETVGAVVTSFLEYPRSRYLNMLFCGGEDIGKWKDPMLSLLRTWARDNGCSGIESTGRPGWAKIFKTDGHTPVWHTYQLPLDDVKDARYG